MLVNIESIVGPIFAVPMRREAFHAFECLALRALCFVLATVVVPQNNITNNDHINPGKLLLSPTPYCPRDITAQPTLQTSPDKILNTNARLG